jgi:hypothetical protein
MRRYCLQLEIFKHNSAEFVKLIYERRPFLFLTPNYS